VTHYEVLGVPPGATAAEVRRAYLHLARTHHPDRHAEGDRTEREAAEARMRSVNEAWAVLGDAARRRAYDDALVDERRSSWQPGTPSPDFVPYDDGDDPDDPAAEHDVPYGDGTPVHRGLQVGPAAALVLAVVALGLGVLLDFRPLMALGILGVVGSILAFAAVPLSVILRSNRHGLD
jgi:hypothetical protein